MEPGKGAQPAATTAAGTTAPTGGDHEATAPTAAAPTAAAPTGADYDAAIAKIVESAQRMGIDINEREADEWVAAMQDESVGAT